MDEKKKYSEDFVAEAVRMFWNTEMPENVMAFFYQKYDDKYSKWERVECLALPEQTDDYETVNFAWDFCEGQTLAKDIIVVPLYEVAWYYAEEKLGMRGTQDE